MPKRKTYQPGEPRPKGKQLDGRYRGKVRLGAGPDGRPIYKYVSASSRPELEKKKAELIQQYREGMEETNAEMLFGALCNEWYEKQRAKGIGAVSLMVYRSMLNKHVLPAFSVYQVRAITYQQVQDWMNGFEDFSESHIDKAYSMIRSLFRYAVMRGIVARDVTLTLTKPAAKPKEERRALTDEETEAVLRTIDEHPEGLFLAVLYYLGLRRGEALGLQWGDIDFDAGLVHIQRDIVYANGKHFVSGLKTPAANRYIPMTDELQAMLLPRRGEADAWVFPAQDGGPMPESTLKRMWLRLMIHAGLVKERPQEQRRETCYELTHRYIPTLTPHYFRHNYITMLYDAGVPAADAMRIVGHADYNTTITIYTHIKNERIKKAGADLEKVFSKNAVAKKLPKTKNFIVRIK